MKMGVNWIGRIAIGAAALLALASFTWTAVAQSAVEYSALQNANIMAPTLRTLATSNLLACQAACEASGACKAYVYHHNGASKGSCLLKAGVAPSNADPAAHAGVRRSERERLGSALDSCPKAGLLGLARTDVLTYCGTEFAYGTAACKLARLNLARIAFETKNTQCESAVRKYGQTDLLIFPANPPEMHTAVCNSALSSPIAPIVFPYLMERVRSRNPKAKPRTLNEAKALCAGFHGSLGGRSNESYYATMPVAAAPLFASSVMPSSLRPPILMAVPAAVGACLLPPVAPICAAAADAALVGISLLSAAIVAIVANDAIDGALDRADGKADPKVDPRVLECDLLWQSYKDYTCEACKHTDKPSERRLKRGCWVAVALLRRKYLDMRCDYILPGSIAKGSAAKERAHIDRWEVAVKHVAECDRKPHTTGGKD